MANVLNNEKKQQILALGQLGWSLRRIQAATHVRRETKSAIEVTTGFGVELRDSRSEKTSGNPSTASACEPFQEAIELGLSRGRNAMSIWQDLVSEHGFSSSYQSVERYMGEGKEMVPETPPTEIVLDGDSIKSSLALPQINSSHHDCFRNSLTLG